MTAILIFLLIISIILNGYLYREYRQLKKQHDYYVSVDEENERLKIEEKSPQLDCGCPFFDENSMCVKQEHVLKKYLGNK